MTTDDTLRKSASLTTLSAVTFRRNGQALHHRGIFALDCDDRDAILEKVRTFDAFTEDNDPHGEHDFGAFDFKGERIFWKIDYYDAACKYGSENPADPAQTTRVLTIMLAEEY